MAKKNRKVDTCYSWAEVKKEIEQRQINDARRWGPQGGYDPTIHDLPPWMKNKALLPKRPPGK